MNSTELSAAELRLHKPVMLAEVIEALNCQSGEFYVDCTLGMGGHSEKVLEASSPDGFLLGIDRDKDAIEFARERLVRFKKRLRIVREDYRMLFSILEANQLPNPSGILADLGASLLQFSSAERGFSFQADGPLDMRMDQRQKETAADIVNTRSAADLRQILREYGEETAAAAIARRIVEERRSSAIRNTGRLRAIIESIKPRRPHDKIHPATQTFQALRIAVNHELEGLDEFLFDAFDALKNGGRLAIIAFHSLEDRAIKQASQFLTVACRCPKRFAVCKCGGEPHARPVWRKPMRPSDREIKENPASRSAKLRAIEKIRGPVQREFWNEWRAAR